MGGCGDLEPVLLDILLETAMAARAGFMPGAEHRQDLVATGVPHGGRMYLLGRVVYYLST